MGRTNEQNGEEIISDEWGTKNNWDVQLIPYL
jgi:hypothetical protein